MQHVTWPELETASRFAERFFRRPTDMPSNFSVDELSTALQEISDWGLQSKQPFQILPAQLCPKDEARAKVELLEDGDSAVIGLSEKGWRIALRTVADPRVRAVERERPL